MSNDCHIDKLIKDAEEEEKLDYSKYENQRTRLKAITAVQDHLINAIWILQYLDDSNKASKDNPMFRPLCLTLAEPLLTLQRARALYSGSLIEAAPIRFAKDVMDDINRETKH